MNILIVHNSKIPAIKYGGIERVIWYLGLELTKLGHNITYLVKEGSYCHFAKIIPIDLDQPIETQIPENIDFVHVHFLPAENINHPHLITMHGTLPKETMYPLNTSFVSKNHAKRHGAEAFVYNGLDWDDYGTPTLNGTKNYVHFLGKAAWRLKNVKGAIKIAQSNKIEIKIIGGTRINLKMGPRFTLTKWAKFYGMIGGEEKNELLKYSKALILPVMGHEAFGLALIESLYYGCPVLGTKYGSLPEIITQECGFLSNSLKELIERFKGLEAFNRTHCHQYARDKFNSRIMAENYLKLYEKILNEERINKQLPQLIESENTLEDFWS